MSTHEVDRRLFLRLGASGCVGLCLGERLLGDSQTKPDSKNKPTKFQIACMTLPYAPFPLERALKGIKDAGYRYVAWGRTHKEAGGKPETMLAEDAPPEKAKELSKRCRDLELEPVMMFGAAPENPKALRHCVMQAAAAGIAQVLTMGRTQGNDARVWVRNFKELGPIARDHGVIIVV